MAQNVHEPNSAIKKESKLTRFGCLVVGLFCLIGIFSPFYYEHQWQEILSLNIWGKLLLLGLAMGGLILGVIFMIVAYKGHLPEAIAKHIEHLDKSNTLE